MDFDTVNVLLAFGANPNLPEDGYPIFMSVVSAVSSHEDSLEMCKLLMRHGVDVSRTDADGEAALHRAARWGTVTTVDFLINPGAPVNGPY